MIKQPGMTNAEYLKARRLAAKERGDCYTCMARPAKPGRSSCQHCIDLTAAAKERAVRKGKCKACVSRPRKRGRNTCDACATKINARSKRRKAERRAQGNCARCDWSAVPGTSLCTLHHQDNRKRTRAWFYRQAKTHRDRSRPDRKAA